MEYLLTGFTHEKDFRVFSFESVGTDKVWTKRTVRADLAIARKHGIALQELPLLCRGLLDRAETDAENLSLTLTEVDIRTLADERASARAMAAAKRKPPVRPAGEQPGAAWRDQNQPVRHGGGLE